ncbi:MAG: alpha-E domain-containing protein [Actinomycetota bacterium]|nr:alpha-E domain-containing protein [Actinomycetota bacterium]
MTTHLLSSVAETVYWTGRLIERTESTSRIVAAHANMVLDLPSTVAVDWHPLLQLTGTMEGFSEHYEASTAESIFAHLITDTRNPGSVVRSIGQARENMRITRSVMPRETWQTINKLHFYLQPLSDRTLPEHRRFSVLAHVIGECQKAFGQLWGTLTHDLTFFFLDMGRQIERSDMTTRVLAVRAESLVAANRDPDDDPYADVQWMSALRSLSALQMFRRRRPVLFPGYAALEFLLSDEDFPRAVRHCLERFRDTADRAGASSEVLSRCDRLISDVMDADVHALVESGLGEFMDEVQLGLIELHNGVAEKFFPPLQPA